MTRRAAGGERRQDQTSRRGDACIARGADNHLRAVNTIRGHTREPARVEIRPEPSPAEREAILMALRHVLDSARRDEPALPSAWALAGRREALLGRSGGPRGGWGRASDRRADW